MPKKDQIEIVCLPVAGDADPGQLLMIRGLNSREEIRAFSGIDDRFFGIIRSALAYTPDIIHFDWLESYYIRRNWILTYLNLPFFYLQVFICRYLLRIKFVWTIHNILPHDRSNIRLKYFVLRSFSNIVNHIRVLSSDSVKEYAKKFRVSTNKIHFVGTGDFTEYYPDNTNKADARKKLGIPENAKVLLTLGSVKRYKGIVEYLKTIKTLEHSRLYILIAGKSYDAALDAEIQSLTDERIHYENYFISHEDLQYYFHAADIAVLPFIAIENSGSIVMAMGFKKPVVAPRSNVLNERLKYQNELLFEGDQLLPVIRKSLNLSSEDLIAIGNKNYGQLKESTWKDLADFFVEIEK